MAVEGGLSVCDREQIGVTGLGFNGRALEHSMWEISEGIELKGVPKWCSGGRGGYSG